MEFVTSVYDATTREELASALKGATAPQEFRLDDRGREVTLTVPMGFLHVASIDAWCMKSVAVGLFFERPKLCGVCAVDRQAWEAILARTDHYVARKVLEGFGVSGATIAAAVSMSHAMIGLERTYDPLDGWDCEADGEPTDEQRRQSRLCLLYACEVGLWINGDDDTQPPMQQLYDAMFEGEDFGELYPEDGGVRPFVTPEDGERLRDVHYACREALRDLMPLVSLRYGDGSELPKPDYGPSQYGSTQIWDNDEGRYVR